DESRGQEHRWLDGPFRQLRIVAIVQHQRLGMQCVVADLGLGRKWFRHGLFRCLEGDDPSGTLQCRYKALLRATMPDCINDCRVDRVPEAQPTTDVPAWSSR